MKKGTRRALGVLGASAAALAALTVRAPVAAQDEATVLSIATQAPEGTIWMTALEKLGEEVKEVTKGRVSFQFLKGGVQGDEKAVVDKMKLGLLHGGLFTGIGLGHIHPEVRVLELPFFYDSIEEIYSVKAKIEPDLVKGFDEKGCVFLGWSEVGWANIWSKEESRNLEELRKRKIWLWEGDPLAEQTFKSFGLSGVPLALPDVLQSLQTGMIDSVYNSPYGLIGLQWHNKVKYMSRMTVGHGTGALVISKTAWAQVPKKLRDKIAKIAREHLDKLNVEVKEKNEESVKQLESQGIKVIPIPEGEIKMYKDLGAQVAEQMVGKLYSKEFLERVKKARDEVRAGGPKKE